MSKLWAVFGKTGEYDDQQEWLVVTYTKRKFAVQHVNLAQQQADTWIKIKHKLLSFDLTFVDRNKIEKKAVPMDPFFREDGQVWYSCVQTTLKPKFIPRIARGLKKYENNPTK